MHKWQDHTTLQKLNIRSHSFNMFQYLLQSAILQLSECMTCADLFHCLTAEKWYYLLFLSKVLRIISMHGQLIQFWADHKTIVQLIAINNCFEQLLLLVKRQLPACSVAPRLCVGLKVRSHSNSVCDVHAQSANTNAIPHHFTAWLLWCRSNYELKWKETKSLWKVNLAE